MPRYNPNDQDQVKRLRDAMAWSRKELKKFVEQYVENLRQYVGWRYGENGSKEKMPLNMTRLAVDVWQRKIVTRAPSILALTRNPELKVQAYNFQLAMDHLLKEINFSTYLQEVTKAALMGFGAMKVGISPKTDVSNPNYRFDAGQPFAEPILWEDWCHDMNARRQDEWDFVGNRYRVDYEDMMDNPMFSPDAKDKISPEDSSADGDLDFGEGDETRSTISHEKNKWQKEEYRPHVELWDIWLPRDGLMVTMSGQGDGPPLMVREWEGPERGPYHMLTFCKVPGNVMGSDPTSVLFNMNTLLNKMFVKISDQGLRQKSVTAVSAQAAANGDAQRFVDAADGDTINVLDPKNIAEVNSGGVNQNSMALVVFARQMASYLGGNIDLVGGLGTQSPTVGQDKILSESSSDLIKYMQGEVEGFTTNICWDLGFYLHNDPASTLKLMKSVPGTNIETAFEYGPERMEDDFREFEIRIQPYSLRSQSPEERLGKIIQLVTQVIGPMMPMLQQQGIILNAEALMGMISRYADLPELEELLVKQMMQQQQGGGGQGQPPGKPASTQRNYVRENRPTGGTQGSKDAVLMQSLMSGSNSNTPQQEVAAGMI